MNLLKKQKISLFVYGIFLVVYNVLYFAIPFPKNSATWLGYFFTLCSFVVSYWSFLMAFQKMEEPESKVYGFPVFRSGIIYLSSQLVFGFVVDLLGYKLRVPKWVVLIVSVILLAYALLEMIATDATRNVIEKQQEDVTIHTEKITYFHLEISRIADKVNEGEVKKKLLKLAEEVRFSDPVSSEKLKEIEARLEIETKKLENMVGGSEEQCLTQIKVVSDMLADRNRRCKESKNR